MVTIKILVSIALIGLWSLIPTTGFGGTSDIYLSFAGFGDGSAADNTSLKLTEGTNASGSVYIWVNDPFRIDTGAFLDVLNSNTGVIAFTNAQVFQANVLVGAIPVNTRWQTGAMGNQGITPGLVNELHGFRVTEGTGILPTQTTGNTFVDSLHDPLSNAFLFARVDFDVIGVGMADLSLEIGNGLIVDNGVALNPNFGGAQVVVNAIPEPSSLAILAAGAVAAVSRRRR